MENRIIISKIGCFDGFSTRKEEKMIHKEEIGALLRALYEASGFRLSLHDATTREIAAYPEGCSPFCAAVHGPCGLHHACLESDAAAFARKKTQEKSQKVFIMIIVLLSILLVGMAVMLFLKVMDSRENEAPSAGAVTEAAAEAVENAANAVQAE